MCCQIFHNFSFKYEHSFSSVTFYICQWGASAVCTLWAPVQGCSCFQGSKKKTTAGGTQAQAGRRGGQWGVDAPPLAPTPGPLCTPRHAGPDCSHLVICPVYSARPLCDKDHAVGGLNHRHLLSHSPGDWPGGWKSEITV